MDYAACEDIANESQFADGTLSSQKRRVAYYYDSMVFLCFLFDSRDWKL